MILKTKNFEIISILDQQKLQRLVGSLTSLQRITEGSSQQRTVLQDKQTERGPPPLTFVPPRVFRDNKISSLLPHHSISPYPSPPLDPTSSLPSDAISPSQHSLDQTSPSLFLSKHSTTQKHSISPLRLRFPSHSTTIQPPPLVPPPSFSLSLDDGTGFAISPFSLLTPPLLSIHRLLDRRTFTVSPSPPFHSISPFVLQHSSLDLASHSLDRKSTSASTSISFSQLSVLTVHSTIGPASPSLNYPPFTRPRH